MPEFLDWGILYGPDVIIGCLVILALVARNADKELLRKKDEQ